jgi:curli biogenesis system outer membrane secretion channel CsgG
VNYPLYHETLCPDLWKGGAMKPDVRKGLLQIARDFVVEYLKENEISLKASDVIVIGSAVNYNWTHSQT